MTPTPSRARGRLALVATVAVALVATGLAVNPAATASPAAAAPTAKPAASAPAATQHRSATKTRLLDALLRGDGPQAPSKVAARAADGARPPADPTADFTRDRAAARTLGADRSTCDDLALDWTIGYDRVVLAWTQGAPGPYTVQRVRDGGAPSTLATGYVSLDFTDDTVNTQGIIRYRVTPADGVVCETPDLTMSSDNGLGEPEAVVGMVSAAGEPRGMVLQDTWSLGVSSQLDGVDPAFSPDGRRVVGSLDLGQLTRVLSVSLVDPSREIRRGTAPAGTLALDPEWSPDGLRIAYTRYSLDPDSHEVSDTQLRVLDVPTGADRVVAGSAGLMQPDWVSATQLIAAGAATGSGLSYIAAAGGTPMPIADTANGAQPDAGTESPRVWFVTDDGTTSRIRAVVRSGPEFVETVRESTTVVYDQPRMTDRLHDGDGTPHRFHVELGPGAVLDDPADDTAVVVEDDYTSAPRNTPIGIARQASDAPWGYDVRRTTSKGTSDFAGDGNGDVLARDAVGRLWVYPFTPSAPAGPRVLVGGGWGSYDLFLAAGDLTGDGRADILARDKTGVLWRYAGRGDAAFATRVRLGSGWAGYLLAAPGDWDGDGHADLFARSPSGELWRYPGTAAGSLGPRVRIGGGWNAMNAVFGAGDFDLDGDPDLLAREAATGTLWLYPGALGGSVGARRKVGSGWNGFSQLSGPELLVGSPAVHGITSAGDLLLYRVVGDGRFDGNEVYRIGSGWKPYRISS